MSILNAVELFCGAGGMSLGLIQSGIKISRAYDSWTPAVSAYRANIGDHICQFDLSNILDVAPEIARLNPDLLCGGPPCQDFSPAGKRVAGENAKMTLAFAIIATAVRPQWIFVENVLDARRAPAWIEARYMLRRAGYGVTEATVDASLLGVPQARRRLVMIARLGESDGFLSKDIADAAGVRPMTLRDCFGAAVPEAIYFHPRMPARRAVWSPDEAAPTLRSASCRPMPSERQPHHGDYLFDSNERAVEARPLTISEMSQVQGFPSSWDWGDGSKERTTTMIANAVPPPLASIIGSIILARDRGATFAALRPDFFSWLIKTGKSPASARNFRSSAGRARRMLAGHTFSHLASEIEALEASPGFMDLPRNIKSDLRSGLRLHAQFERQMGEGT